MMLILFVTSMLLFSNVAVLGQPVLNTSTGPELFGELCPGTRTFICNALNFGTNGLIEWYIDNILLAQFLSSNANGNFPYTVTLLEPPILNASVQISNSTFVNGQFSYINFTLTVDVSELSSFHGQNVTCGTMTERSNAININNFTTLEESVENISYWAKYRGAEGELEEIGIQWIDQFQLAKCEVTTSYTVQLMSSEGEITRMILSTQNCTNGKCSIQFSSNLKNAASYEITLVADNQFNDDNFTSTAFMNTTGNLISFNTCNNTASITCSTSINKSCTVTSNDSTNPAILMPGQTDLLTFYKTPESICITITINSTILTQTFKLDRGTMSDTENGVFVEVGIAVFIFGCIIFILGCVLGIVSKVQNNAYKDYRYMWSVILLFSIISMAIFIVTLVLWIIVGSTSSLDSCINDRVSPDPIFIAALMFSFVFLLLATIIFGWFLIALKCERKYRSHKKVQFIDYKVQFGSKGPRVWNSAVADKCGTCNEHYSTFSEKKNGEKVFADKQRKQLTCKTCFQSVCDECSKVVYLKYCKQKREVCKNCYKSYKVEQRKISGLPQFGKNQPPKVPQNKQCYECGIGEGENSYKWKTKEEYTAEISCCAACGHVSKIICACCYRIYTLFTHRRSNDILDLKKLFWYTQ